MSTPQIERDRRKRIAENNARLADLEIPHALTQFAAAVKAAQPEKRRAPQRAPQVLPARQKHPRACKNRTAQIVGCQEDVDSAADPSYSPGSEPEDELVEEMASGGGKLAEGLVQAQDQLDQLTWKEIFKKHRQVHALCLSAIPCMHAIGGGMLRISH
jgi:hypothetical protein